MAEKLTDNEVQRLEALAKQLSETKAGVANVNICDIWNKIKPHWSLIVRIVKAIPVVGGTLSTILTSLGAALDALCP